MSGAVMNEKDGHYAEAKWVTQVGTAGDFILTVAKIVIGLLTNSAALVAEGLHSGADLLFDLVVLLGMKVARKSPDESHPYGHGKFEGLASILLAVILLLVAVGIVIDAAHRMMQSDALSAPGQLAFWVALFSIITKELLFQYTVRVGRKLKSNIMMANAWHHRADAISSLAAMIGIGGALMGFPILDPAAAIAVAFFVSKVSFEIGGEAIKELTDSAASIDEETRELIRTLIKDHSQVTSIHDLRARRLGPDILVDVHVEVDPFLSVSEGHLVADKVRAEVLSAMPAITEVVVHVDVEHDWRGPENRAAPQYPSRQELLGPVVAALPRYPGVVGVQELVPHYTSDGVVVELVLEIPEEQGVASLRRSALALGEVLMGAGLGVKRVKVRAALASTIGE